MHEIQILLKDSPKLDIIGITEARLSHHDSSLFQISGYTLIRKDATFVGDTGIVLYINPYQPKFFPGNLKFFSLLFST